MEKYERIDEVDLLSDFKPIKLVFVGESIPTARIIHYKVELPEEMKKKIHQQIMDKHGISASVEIEAATIKVYAI